MSNQSKTTQTSGKDESAVDDREASELRAQLELLTEENQRLRADYTRSRRTRYRRTAFALIAVGVVAAASSLFFVDTQAVLLALGGTGIFAGILTYYLTPERFIAASTGERVYTALAAIDIALTNELGLQDIRIYLPSGASDSTNFPARLFVPQQAGYTIPENSALSTLFLTDRSEARGVALYPTGGPLFREFERVLSTDLYSTPEALAEQLIDGLIEQFELVDSATIDVDASNEQVTVGVTGSVYGSADRFDHPVTSFLGVGFAVGLDHAIVIKPQSVDSDRADVLVICSWSESEGTIPD